MLEIKKSEEYIISTFDIKMVAGSGKTKKEALEDYIKGANETIKKAEIELKNLKNYVEEAETLLKEILIKK